MRHLWRLYYHLIWATKERQPFITAEIESELYGYIAGKVEMMDGITYAIGGIEDHIHLIVTIAPKISIGEFVRNIKGSSTHYVNFELGKLLATQFSWQRGYGVFSLGGKQLTEAVEYVKNQKLHHQRGSLKAMLEQTIEEEDAVSLRVNSQAKQQNSTEVD
jgi:putative transposase